MRIPLGPGVDTRGGGKTGFKPLGCGSIMGPFGGPNFGGKKKSLGGPGKKIFPCLSSGRETPLGPKFLFPRRGPPKGEEGGEYKRARVTSS